LVFAPIIIPPLYWWGHRTPKAKVPKDQELKIIDED